MESIEKLGNQLSQITFYDVKSVYNQAKNMVLNVSEMEAKVREATNDDPWGASSTLMQEIAQGTFNFQQFNEIMPCIYSRFMDKEARQWREIYKALQLLEYIVKHGSERVVDDARSHISTIKMLRNFHYIDEKGKDQGINVRNRAKELAELLSDVERIRTERRKAKANRNKYVGTGNDGMSFSSGDGRYGGFGNGGLGSGNGSGSRSYDRDNYGGYSGSSGSGFRDSVDRRGFEEYNAGDDEVPAPRRSDTLSPASSSAAGASNRATSESTTSRAAQKKQEKVVDLLGFDDDDFGGSSSAAPVAEKALPAVASNPLEDDDDFADFQTAPTPASAAAPAATSLPTAAAPAKPTVYEMLNASRPTASPITPTMSPMAALQPQLAQTTGSGKQFGMAAGAGQARPANTLGMGMNMGMSNSTGMLSPTSPRGNTFSPTSSSFSNAQRPAGSTASSFSSATSGGHAKTSSSAGGFDDLWNLSLGSGTSAKSTSNTGGGKSIKELEKEKAQAGIWGAGQGAGSGSMGGFGNFGGSTNTQSGGSAGGVDDLLL